MLKDRATARSSHVRPLVVFKTVPQKLVLVIETKHILSSLDWLHFDVSSHAACCETLASFWVYSVGPTIVYA